MNKISQTIPEEPKPGRNRVSRSQLASVLRASSGTITVEQASKALRLPSTETAKTLARWAKQGWLSRVQRGLYVPVPLTSRSSEVSLEDPWLVAEGLFAPCYIGGWSAAEHWGMTEQIYRSILVMTTRKPRNRNPVIKGTAFVLRSIQISSLFGTKSVWRGQVKVSVSDPSRTVLDLMDDPLLGGGIRPSADMFQHYLGSEHKNLKLLLEYAERFQSGAACKRLGFLLERYAPQETEAIAALRAQITQGNVKLDASLPADRLITAWRLWVPTDWKEDRHD